MRSPAFTLVELLIIVIVLGLLANMVAPQFTNASETDRTHAATLQIATIQQRLATEGARNGVFPENIPSDWFKNGVPPENPFHPNAAITFNIVDSDDLHPKNKTDASKGAFWYNKRNGLVRAIVIESPDRARIIAIYNAVNKTNITRLNQVN